jgi:predicted RNA binding protein YcfA (HicA-like mRNA interferase family)
MLEADGWRHVKTRGSHHQFKHPAKPGRATIPHPKNDMPIKTANSILKKAGLK